MSQLNDPIQQLTQGASALGIDRLRVLFNDLIDINKIPFVLSVAGTNGKGTTVAAINSIYIKNSIKAAAFTSPHVFTVHERMSIAGNNISDRLLRSYVIKLKKILKQKNTQLCYFEVCFLVACMWFSENNCKLWIVEAGIGGEKDSINLLACKLLVLTQVEYDHCDILGASLDAIAQQKLGLLRQGSFFICGADKSISAIAKALVTHKSLLLGRDFSFYGNYWRGCSKEIKINKPQGLLANNIALAIATVFYLRSIFVIDPNTIDPAINAISLLGRQMQIKFKSRNFYLDVAHNPASCAELATRLDAEKAQSISAVFSCARNKDAAGCLAAFQGKLSKVFSCQIAEHMYSPQELQAAFPGLDWHFVADSSQLLTDVIAATDPGATIVIFGSFRLVAAVLASIELHSGSRDSCLVTGDEQCR